MISTTEECLASSFGFQFPTREKESEGKRERDKCKTEEIQLLRDKQKSDCKKKRKGER